MPKQTLLQRVTRLLSDAAAKEDVDLHGRWQKIVDDSIAADVVAKLGPMPTPTLDDVDESISVPYAGRDADATYRIEPILSARVKEMGLEKALELDLSIIPMVSRMMEVGMLVDRPYLSDLTGIFQSELERIQGLCWKVSGFEFNVGSSDQVADLLFNRLRLNGRRKTGSGKRLSADEKALEAIKGLHPVIGLIQEYREVDKLRGTYSEKILECLSPDGRIRMELGLTTIPSGRLNCWGGVNLLGIPVRTELGRMIRGAFIAGPGRMLGAGDLSQIELRWLAILSGDEKLLEAYYNDEDLHAKTACALFGVVHPTFEQRQRGKTTNFAIANQISPLGLLDQYILAGVPDADELMCQRDLDKWFNFYRGVKPWFESVYAEGRLHGYIRDSVSGRILYCPNLRSPIERVRAEAERICTNWKIQTAAQVTMKMGMKTIWDCIEGTTTEPLLQVHDEILLETDEDVDMGPIMMDCLESVELDLPIPIKAAWHQGKNWSELK